MIDPQRHFDWLNVIVAVATSLIGAVIGFISGVASEIWRTNRAERKQIDNLERAIYSEMTDDYSFLRYHFKQYYKEREAAKQETANDSDWAHLAAQLARSHSVIDSYRYAESNPHLFYRIKHNSSIRRIYSHLIKIHEVGKNDAAVLGDVFRFCWSMTSAVRGNRLNLTLFKEIAPRAYEDVQEDIRESVNGQPKWTLQNKAASQGKVGNS